MKKIIYKRNKENRRKGLIFSILVLIVGIAIGAWIYLFNDKVSNAIAAFDLILILLGLFLIVYNSFFNKSVIISNNGLYTYVNSIKLIPWKHIQGFEIKKHKGITYLIILIEEPKLFILQKKLRARELMKQNLNDVGYLVAIPETEFDKPLEIVKEEIENFRNTNVNKYQVT
jgi:hypothetical protein